MKNHLLLFGLLAICNGCAPQSDIASYKVTEDAPAVTTDRLMPVFQARVPPPIAEPEFDVPEQWRKTANDQFSLAAYAAGPNERPVRITVTRTPAMMGIESQLNRWRTQLGLEPSDEVAINGESIEVGGEAAQLVKFQGEEESIVGTIISRTGQMWFFKMRGPKVTVEEQFEAMKKFCEQVRL